MRSSRASSDKRRGQAVIESSLILLIFIPVLIGILDFGQFLYFHQSLSERARAGARYAAVHTFDATKIANYTLYNDDTGTTNGATALLPKVNDPSGAATQEEARQIPHQERRDRAQQRRHEPRLPFPEPGELKKPWTFMGKTYKA